jgi:hypothetical protein
LDANQPIIGLAELHQPGPLAVRRGAQNWLADGRAVVFSAERSDRTDAEGLSAVEVTATGEDLAFSTPKHLFRLHPPGVLRNAFSPAPDGSRILALVPVANQPPVLTVRLDWRPGVSRAPVTRRACFGRE